MRQKGAKLTTVAFIGHLMMGSFMDNDVTMDLCDDCSELPLFWHSSVITHTDKANRRAQQSNRQMANTG